MNKRVLLVLGILAVIVAASALSGCTTTNGVSPIPGTGTSTPTTGASTSGSGDKITVTKTDDKVTITGGKGEKIKSDPFPMSKDAWYIVKIQYTGAEMTAFMSALVNQQAIDEDLTALGQLTIWLGPETTEKIYQKGSLKSEDYMIYIDSADGPWTIEILKNPTGPVTTDKTFSGTSNKVTPFFHLDQGTASFTMNQRLKGQYSIPLGVDIYNADTGDYIGNLAHNDNSATLTATEDIPTSGNYVLEIYGGDDWDISYSQ